MEVKLRKGNIITIKMPHNIQNMMVSSFDLKEDRVFAYGLQDATPYNLGYWEIMPVIITKHRLKKLGFVSVKDGQWRYKECIVKTHGETFDVWIERSSLITREIHELQNFYFRTTMEDIPLSFLRSKPVLWEKYQKIMTPLEQGS